MAEVKITGDQKTILLNYMEEHPEFAKGKLLGPEGKKTKAALWEVLATQLNSADGPKKPTIKWQRVWIDLKNKTKKKAAKIKRNRQVTGGGPPNILQLTDFEEKIVCFLTEEAVHGLEDPTGLPLDGADPVPESGQKAGPSQGHTMEYDHDYYMLFGKSVLSTALVEDSITPASVTSAGSYIASKPESLPAEEQKTPRRKKKSTSEGDLHKFTALSESLNRNVEFRVQRLDTQNDIRRETNNLLRELIEKNDVEC